MTNEKLGPNVIEIQGKIPIGQVNGTLKHALSRSFGFRGGEQGFQSTSVGPTFGAQVARSAVIAIIFSLLVISAYVAIRFEPKYAIPVIIALFHDILITAGVYSLTGQEVTSGTVAAFLTILGYSMYDTVIVFDRIRENVPRMPRAAFSQIANKSMSEVLTRSLITGLSTVFLVTVLYIFGGATLKDFAFAMMVGVLSGAYSSIFIATPVLTHWKEREPAYRARRERLIEEMGRLPTFPEDNVVAKVGDDGEPAPAAAAAPRRDRAGRRSRPQPPAPVEAGPPRAPTERPRSSSGDRARAEPEPRAAAAAGQRAAASAAVRAPAQAPPAAAPAAKAREEPLVALVVWFTVGLALWHFTVFLPDRFWAGIVGALLGAVAGAMLSGGIAQIASGRTIGDTDIGTALIARSRAPWSACRDLRDRRARRERCSASAHSRPLVQDRLHRGGSTKRLQNRCSRPLGLLGDQARRSALGARAGRLDGEPNPDRVESHRRLARDARACRAGRGLLRP